MNSPIWRDTLLDTWTAPWMEFAQAELGKKVHELAANDAFIAALRSSLNIDSQMRSIERQVAQFGSGSMLLEGAPVAKRYRLLPERKLADPSGNLLGHMEAQHLRQRNPEIGKYFDGVVTDPRYDKKKRPVPPTQAAGESGQITAWCAAFVNWCLGQAGVPRLGYATARSWLDFGTPVSHPAYGCLVIVKPSASTGSTTGHVAFFVRSRGDRVVLLGGNQGDAVSEASFRAANVLGYRWPTRIRDYLLDSGRALA